jgi:glutamine synthetase
MTQRPDKLAANVELLVADLNGIPRGKIVEGTSLRPGYLPHLAASNFFQTITGNYADAMDTYIPSDGDMLLEPDWNTYRAVPWRGESHAQVICRTLEKSGDNNAFDPRYILTRILDRYKARGWYPVVAPEAEFFLLEPKYESGEPLRPALGKDGRRENGGESFSIDALDKFSGFVSELQQNCEKAKIQLKAISHEMGPAQIELNIDHGDALSRADQLFFLKRAVKASALQHGFTATFMAKPIQNMVGSGLHIHTSLNDVNDKNVFALNDGKVGSLLEGYIAGLQHYLPHAFAFFAPTINSYKRFVPGLSAPVNLEWGYDNRTTGLRVPFDSDENGRVENRVAGADANPYLFIAATLACGLLGMEEALKAREPVEGLADDFPTTLPDNLASALSALQNSIEIKNIFGTELIDAFISVKKAEISHFSAEVSSWEQRYLSESL